MKHNKSQTIIVGEHINLDLRRRSFAVKRDEQPRNALFTHTLDIPLDEKEKIAEFKEPEMKTRKFCIIL